METFNRLIDPPSANSRIMRAYMQAILETTGLMAGEAFPLELFMGNYRTHLNPKSNFPYPTLEKDSTGMYSLTPEGQRFFSSRLTSEPIVQGQKIGRSDVLDMVRCILAEQAPEGWESFNVQVNENA